MPLLVLFCLSGASGLIYQIIWVRELGLHFGSTVHSAALVTALFMLGLGLGSRFAGSLADRRFGPRPAWSLSAYSVSELAIAALAVVAAIVMPLLGSVFTGSASYSFGADGWARLSLTSSALRYSLATVLLLPITVLMGGTLTLLIRYRVRVTGAFAGRDVAALYGANTLGAALGCISTDLWLVPSVGLFTTQLIAAGLNVFAGLGVWFLVRPDPSKPESEPAPEAPVERPRVFVSLCVVLALTGFVSMGMEMLWFRHLSSLLGSRRLVFSMLLAVMLLFMWLGTRLSAWLLTRGAPPRETYGLLQLVFIGSALLGLYVVTSPDMHTTDLELREVLSPTAVWSWRLFALEVILSPVLLVVAAPSLVMGASFPLANAAAQRTLGRVGRRAGTLYLSNSVGAAAGSLVTGFTLLPWLGLQSTALVLLSSSLVAVALLFLVRSNSNGETATTPKWVIGLGLAGALGGLATFAALPSDDLLMRTIPSRLEGSTVVAAHEGPNETILVTEHPRSGRRLLTNGFSMSGTSAGGQRYMRLFAHLPLLQFDAPKKAAVICFGVGNTLHAASLHPLETLEVIDLSEDILKLGFHFAATNHHVLRDPKVRVFVNDGRQHLRLAAPASYDLITAEPPPLGHAGVAALYSLDFYRIVERALRDGGWFTQWLPIYQLTEDMARSVVATFLAVFPDAVLLSGDRSELILVGVKGTGTKLDLELLKKTLAARPAVAADLAAVSLGSLSELVGTFAGGSEALRRATKGVPLITDDQPLMEYQTAIFAPRRRLPRELFNTNELGSFCPDCGRRGSRRAELATLDGHLEVLQAVYESDTFLEPGTPADADLRKARRAFVVPTTISATTAIAASAYLKRMTGPRLSR